MKIVFFDTETTGMGKDDRLLQLAYIEVDPANENLREYGDFFFPPVPISIEAMSVHHITDDMVASKPEFAQSPDYERIKDLFEDKETYMVAHNAKFDIEMLGREGIKPRNVICTLKLARHFDADGMIPQYKLQYLRYLFALKVPNATAHDALGDVRVLNRLFRYYHAKFEFPNPIEEVLKVMTDISARPSAIVRFQFGKYKGEKIADIAQRDSGYLQWLKRAESEKPDPDTDLLYTLSNFV